MFRKLISLDKARQILKQNFSPKPIGVERIPLSRALGRVLSEDMKSPMDVPSFSRSTVDGYAVRAVDTFGAGEDKPVVLKFCGQVSAGEYPSTVVENGMAAEIATGAPLPKGADAVVMVEYSTRSDDNVFLHRPASKKENVMEAGSDIRRGEKILEKHRRLSSRSIGILAALGMTEVDVYKRPRVAVLSTGAEVVEPGTPLPTGKVYDINAHALGAAVLECGGEPINMGIVPDNKGQLKAAVRRAMNLADLVVTSGGVSVGLKDLIPQVVDALGKPGVIISGIAVKPGKPTTIAIVDGKLVFSLPGHPTSSLFMFHMFVRPIVCKIAGRPEETPRVVNAVAATKMFPARGRRTFVMVSLTYDKAGTSFASPVPVGLSGAITTLAKADGFVEIPERQQFIDVGTEIDVHLFSRNG